MHWRIAMMLIVLMMAIRTLAYVLDIATVRFYTTAAAEGDRSGVQTPKITFRLCFEKAAKDGVGRYGVCVAACRRGIFCSGVAY